MKTPPHPLDRVFHYANAQPTEATWRRIVLGPIQDLILVPGADPPAEPTFGVASLAELERILDDYRALLERWTKLESPYSEEADELLALANSRSRLRFKGWRLSAGEERLVEDWETEAASFDELIYSFLAAALREVSYRSIHRCAVCSAFFFDPSKRNPLYCSARCRNRIMIRRFRERQRQSATAKPAATKRGRKPKKSSSTTKGRKRKDKTK